MPSPKDLQAIIESAGGSVIKRRLSAKQIASLRDDKVGWDPSTSLLFSLSLSFPYLCLPSLSQVQVSFFPVKSLILSF